MAPTRRRLEEKPPRKAEHQPIRTSPSQFIEALQVPAGFDVADDKIVERVEAGDLVITADIPG